MRSRIFEDTMKMRVADPNVNLFLVDDTITTGTMFIRTNYFIKFSRKAIKEDELRGLDGFIVMLDRSNEFVFENVKRKLEHRGDSFFRVRQPAYTVIEANWPAMPALSGGR